MMHQLPPTHTGPLWTSAIKAAGPAGDYVTPLPPPRPGAHTGPKAFKTVSLAMVRYRHAERACATVSLRPQVTQLAYPNTFWVHAPTTNLPHSALRIKSSNTLGPRRLAKAAHVCSVCRVSCSRSGRNAHNSLYKVGDLPTPMANPTAPTPPSHPLSQPLLCEPVAEKSMFAAWNF